MNIEQMTYEEIVNEISPSSNNSADHDIEFARRILAARDAQWNALIAGQAGEAVAWRYRFHTDDSLAGKPNVRGWVLTDIRPPTRSGDIEVEPLFASPPAPQEAQAGIALAIHYPDCWDTAAYPTMQSALVEVYAHFCCTNQDTHVVASGQEERADAEAFWRWFYRKCPAILSDKVRALWMESSEYAEMLAATVAQPATEQAEAPSVELDFYDEIECDLPYLFGRASLEGHEAGQRLACQVRTKMQAARAALASKPVAPPAREPLTTLRAQVAAMRKDEGKGDTVFRCGFNGAVVSVLERIDAALSATTPAPAGQTDALRELFALHAAEVENNPYAYCEVAYTRATGWMAWITDKPLACVVESPDRKVLLRGQGDTPEEAAAAAIRAARGDEVNQK